MVLWMIFMISARSFFFFSGVATKIDKESCMSMVSTLMGPAV